MPPTKKIKQSHYATESGSSRSNTDSFSTQSFIENRDKTNWPHFPVRRKPITQVVEEMSDVNVDLENHEMEEVYKKNFREHQSSSMLEMNSFDSTDSETLQNTKNILKQLNVQQESEKKENKKNQCDIKVSKTQRIKDVDKFNTTPLCSRKKFFKEKCPGLAAKCFAALHSKKDFELKFVTPKSKKPKILRTEPVVKVQASMLKNVDASAMFYMNEELKSDGTENEDGYQSESLSLIDSSDETNASQQKVDGGNMEKTVSGFETSAKDQCVHPMQRNAVTLDYSLTTGHGHDQNCDSVNDDVCVIPGMFEDLFSTESITESVVPEKRTHDITCSPFLFENSLEICPMVPYGDISLQGASGQCLPVFKEDSPQSQSKQLQKLRTKIFAQRSETNESPLLETVMTKDKMKQMTIDADHKRHGSNDCDMSREKSVQSDPGEETMPKSCQSILRTLKFPCWKKERVIEEYVDTCCRVIMVTADDPKYAIKKVEEINKIVSRELGFPKPVMGFRPTYKAFLFLSSENMIEGCCWTEPVSQAYRVLSDSGETSQCQSSHRLWNCSDTPEKAFVGICQIWVNKSARLQGIATQLVDCIRHWTKYGTVIPRHLVAFLDPTADGMIFAEKYTGTPNFLVYKYH